MPNNDEFLKQIAIIAKEAEAETLLKMRAREDDCAEIPGVKETAYSVPESLKRVLQNKNADKSKERAEMSAAQMRKANIHEGHRGRVRFAVDKDPEFDSFSDHEVLEYLLFDSFTRGDVNPYAHELINHFGSLWGVLSAHTNDLMKFSYISEKTARRLNCLLNVARRAEISRLKNNVFFDSTSKVAEYLGAYLKYRDRESIYVACLDINDRLLGISHIAKGDNSFVQIDVKRIVEAALHNGATKVIIAHNHPAETLSPSIDDINATKKLSVTLLSMHIILVDHIIFTTNDCFSFFANGLMESIYKNCDEILGSDLCKQIRQRKLAMPETVRGKYCDSGMYYVSFNMNEEFLKDIDLEAEKK